MNAYLIVFADALGVWQGNGRAVAFCLEHDTGTEALTVLVGPTHQNAKTIIRIIGDPLPVSSARSHGSSRLGSVAPDATERA